MRITTAFYSPVVIHTLRKKVRKKVREKVSKELGWIEVKK